MRIAIMSNTKTVVKAAVTAALAAGIFSLASAQPAAAPNYEFEKCYGVNQAGKNDCAAASGAHSCAGQSTASADAGEWIYVPKGVCEKIAGGKMS
jgi:uncharacterized membrane protein